MGVPTLEIRYTSATWESVGWRLMTRLIQIIFYNTVCTEISTDRQTQLCLGTFEYTEANREIYRKWIAKSKQHPTTLHVSVCDYCAHSIIICSCLSVTVRYCAHSIIICSCLSVCHCTLCCGPHGTEQHKNIYITWEVLWGPFDRTVGSIWPQAEIKINKK
jgi:hypothetical protein